MKRIWSIFTLVIFHCVSHAQNDTFQVYFNLGEPKLNATAKSDITRLINNKQIYPGQQLIILGYADYLGSNEYNFKLSRLRAEGVKEHLTASGFDTNHITICIGKGKIERNMTGKEGRLEDRKVQIIAAKARNDKGKRITNTNQFDITGLKAGDIIPLNRIFFNFGTAEMTDSSYFELATLSVFLKMNESVKIQIEGHLCCGNWKSLGKRDLDTGVGSMSARRAKAVHDFLVDNGIDRNRLKYIGLGTTQPFVNPEKNAADEALNRRVAIRILSR